MKFDVMDWKKRMHPACVTKKHSPRNSIEIPIGWRFLRAKMSLDPTISGMVIHALMSTSRTYSIAGFPLPQQVRKALFSLRKIHLSSRFRLLAAHLPGILLALNLILF